MNELASVLNWLRDSISALLQWLQKYKAGYLVAVLIAARITATSDDAMRPSN
ncbi:MAG TPA: hypothetical protein VIE37_18895 [Methylomirabilota bacterium]|jgi:hypothetical protein